MPGNDDIQVIVGRDDVSSYIDNLSWSAVDPGGFEAASMDFQRNVRIPRGTDVKINYGQSVAWEGRVNEVNRQLSAQPITQLGCQGYGARYKENGQSMVFVDRDTGKWGSLSRAWRAANVAGNYMQGDPTVSTDLISGLPSVTLALITGGSAKYATTAEYDAGALNKISHVYIDTRAPNGGLVAPWAYRLYGSDYDDGSTSLTTTNTDVPPQTEYVAMNTAVRFGVLEFRYDTAGGLSGVSDTPREYYIRNVAVYGNHGLPRRGYYVTTANGTIVGPDPGGFYPDDIVNYVQEAAYPLAKISAGVIESVPYVIPHLAYYAPVPWEQMIDEMAKVSGFHYGTWEGPALHFRSYPGTPTCWTDAVSVDDLQINDSMDGLYNVAKVAYRDPAGSSGVATCTRTIGALDEPGITRTLFTDIGIGTSGSATAFGNLVLAISERNAATTGSFATRLPMICEGGDTPAFMLRPGIDRLKITDLTADGDGQTEMIIKRVTASVNTQGVSTQVEMGRGADLIEALQSRLAQGLTPIGL